MTESNATILIPDISGFTEFMTNTELSHGSRAINILMDAILKAVDNEYEVAEIEGDAVLLIKKGQAPSRQAIQDICIKIFNAFHFQRRWMQLYNVCPCGACKAITHLTLKFIVHHGPLAEVKIGGFIKQSGLEMIVAHRLMKNSIDSNEYLLITEKLFQQMQDTAAPHLEWIPSSEEYSSIGKVEYHFAKLGDIRKGIPEPPQPGEYSTGEIVAKHEISIAANFMDVYMVVMDIPGRSDWMPGLQKVEQEFPAVFIGSTHFCVFEDYQAVLSPLRMVISNEEILYAESCEIKELGLSLVSEYSISKDDNADKCRFAGTLFNAGVNKVSHNLQKSFQEKMQLMANSLKEFCEKQRPPIPARH